MRKRIKRMLEAVVSSHKYFKNLSTDFFIDLTCCFYKRKHQAQKAGEMFFLMWRLICNIAKDTLCGSYITKLALTMPLHHFDRNEQGEEHYESA